MSGVIQTFIQTAIVSGIFVYVGKTMLDRLIKRGEEFEKLKEKQIEINVGRIEKANEVVRFELRELQKQAEELKLSVLRLHHKVESIQEKNENTAKDLKEFVNYADKIMRDIEKSNIIELGRVLQMIKSQKKP